jgi:hypothetical protein
MSVSAKPTESERATKPGYNWFHNYSGRPEFSWDDCEVSQEEYQRHARDEDVAFVDEVLL